MDNAKIYIYSFLGLTVVLLVFLLLSKSESEQTIVTMTVESNTLTQSLDGHRRYLVVRSEQYGQQRVSVPPSSDCPVGANASFEVTSTLISATHFKFLSCRYE